MFTLSGLIGLLIFLVILGVVVYVANIVISVIPLPSWVKQVVYAIVGLIAFLYLLSYFGLYTFPVR